MSTVKHHPHSGSIENRTDEDYGGAGAGVGGHSNGIRVDLSE
jgi:hypothetical protein